MGTTLRQATLLLLTATTLVAAAAFAGEIDDALAAFDKAWKGSDYQAKVAAIEALLDTGDIRAVSTVVEKALVCDDQFVFERAVEMLQEKTDAQGRRYLVEQATDHKSKDLRVVLVRMLGTLDAPEAAPAIVKALKDREWTVRAAAVRACRTRREKALVKPLIDAVAAEDGRVRHDAIDALRDLTGADYGKDAKKWAAWWAEAEAGFKLKPPLAEDGDADASDVTKDVGTVAREGLYEIRSKRTLFIVDVSASMEAKTAAGTRLEVTKKELKRVLGDMTPDMLFNVLFFSDRTQLWKPKMMPASQSNRSAASRLIDAAKPTGLTGTFDALKTALAMEDVDTIYFLSDGFPTVGQVTSEELIKTEVRRWNRTKGIAIHTIAFVAGELKGENEDKARARTFMKELAAENGGTYKVVE